MRSLAVLLAAALALPAAAGAAPGASRLAPEVQEKMRRARPDEPVTVIVHLRGQADLSRLRGADRGARAREAVRELRAKAGPGQRAVKALLQARRAAGRVHRQVDFWIFNGLSVTATPDVVRELASHPDVLSVTPDEIDVVPAALPAGPPEPNLTAIRVPDLWSLGIGGQGVVVATLDSGVDASHPDLAGRWRGGSNSWLDPYGQHASPADLDGHGTWTLGVLLGGDAGGTTIGAAPEARWISARIFNDAGAATATAIHQAFQWLLDPDGDPATADAPQVVNHSWSYGSPGCNLEFQPDVQALRAAGIAQVFAAGNFGPAAPSSVSPGNYPEAFAVGSVDGAGAVAAESGRGPSACGGSLYPAVVAPGVDILTAERFSLYAVVSGTSIATPHVAGAMALLRGAFPWATVDQLESALEQSAVDLGAAGPDNASGWGLVDARAAHDLLATGPVPPTAGNDAYSVAEGTSGTFTAPGVLGNDVDPGSLPLTAELVGGPSHGALSLQPDGGFSYTPAAGYGGSDAFTYRASNGTLASNPATVAIAVTPAARPPAAADDAFAVAEDATLSAVAPGVLGNDSDPAGKPLTAVLVAAPASGALTLRPDGSFRYAPRANFSGTDSFRYRPSNGTIDGNAATVVITVVPVTDPPVAADDSASVQSDPVMTFTNDGSFVGSVSAADDTATTPSGHSVTIEVLKNDTDPDGTIAPGTLTIVTRPKKGSTSIPRKSPGTVVYTPYRGFTGTDSFTYRVKNEAGLSSNLATVRIKVQ
jgi:subtilisin family serine protease